LTSFSSRAEVIVERGTPEGFRILETMREHFLETVNGAGGRKVDEEATLSPEAHILGPVSRTCA
jgi:ribosomal protein RSM22 (predicted rRNA methylase)